MLAGTTTTKFGRVQAPPPQRFSRLHFHREGTRLKEVSHDIPLPVLDQEDLDTQGIDTSALVKGAQRVTALGSCTCNAGTACLAERLAAAGKSLADAVIPGYPVRLSETAAVGDEEFAIVLYHLVTDQTGNPASEWPPADCGSSGYDVCTELERLRLAASCKSAADVTGGLSMLQDGTVMQGSPWFESWMTPDKDGFVDGDGSLDALRAAIESGVAGGHETVQRGIPQLGQLANGTIDLSRTVIRVRNSWSADWPGSLVGDFLLHASTLNYLSSYVDYKQPVIN